MLNGSYVRGVKVEMSLSSEVEKRTAVNEAASHEILLPYKMPNRDPRLRNMLYRQQQMDCGGLGNWTPSQSGANTPTGYKPVTTVQFEVAAPTAARYYCCDVKSSLPSLLPKSPDGIHFSLGRFDQRTSSSSKP